MITKSGWQIRCLPALDNGPGEGFAALSPSGVEYRFTRLRTRSQLGHRSQGAVLNRQEVRLFASLVTDRFGNTVNYNWDASNRLGSISASDGRSITIGYPDSSSSRISSVSDGTRTYQYGYDTNSNLSSVTQPDGARWQFNLSPLVPTKPLLLGSDASCSDPGYYPAQDYTGSVTHPSGAVGSFVLRFINHPKADVPLVCSPSLAGARYPVGPADLHRAPRFIGAGSP